MATSIVYCAVSNIPAKFRSVDLRNFFSQLIEGRSFICFHYRHRPEELRDPTADEFDPESASLPNEETSAVTRDRITATRKNTCCCVVALEAKQAERFIKMYVGTQWVDSKGDWLASRCVIKRIRVSENPECNTFIYKTKKEIHASVSLNRKFTESDLKRLPELNPPALMPNGNVGTPSKVFLELIQACRLPPSIIKKLGLKFHKTGSNRRYGNVPFEYQNTETVELEETVYTASGVEISEMNKEWTQQTHQVSTGSPKSEDLASAGSKHRSDSSDEDDDTCEEWERHEALYEDVTTQERTKERLFEEEIELKWEKGGSGLVFYTDAQYWQEENGDFDEETADDWDVDMSVYYDKDGGDKDARDYVRMRYEKRLRDGEETESLQSLGIGSFEKYTKGIGRRLMEKQGWKEGCGLGHSQPGITEALENDGQHPRCKRGLGYHGEKLNTFVKTKKRPCDSGVRISTIYDEPEDGDKGDLLLRRQPATSMKYRQNWVPKCKSSSSKQN
ncbi:G patch domain-containing protein 3 [Polypterus senegalus]|uniref:G patch domain-containing protein 3 n=1 Tax=Polypterus senegalus TaxID=55291 RepID=UPI001965989B|nr:G patch domain-containing protein 3 [Polypterus senegalus]